MAIFKPPKITSEALLSTVLLKGEIVYNETDGNFYTGDDVTAGGLKITGPVENASNANIPTKLSELENDCNFVTSIEEQDSVFTSVSGQFALKSEIPSIPTVPTKTSELENDSNFLSSYTETDPVFAAASAQFALKSDIPTIPEITVPTKVSELENDSQFLTSFAETDPVFAAASGNFATASALSAAVETINGKQDKIDANNKLSYEFIEGTPEVPDFSENVTVSSSITDNKGVDHNVFANITSTGISLTSDSVFGSSALPSTVYDQKMFLVNIGIDNKISGFATTVIGKGNTAAGAYAVTLGYGNYVYEAAGVAHGHNNEVRAGYGHAEGQSTKVYASYGHSEGCGAVVSGQWAHAEGGEGAVAEGNQSHAEGRGHAIGIVSHAEGLYATAVGEASHAEGNSSIASGAVSHAEGYSTNASGEAAHTEGKVTWAAGAGAHAEGYGAHADFECSHAEGELTSTAEAYQHVEGKYNAPVSGFQHVVGGGDENGRKNIQTLDWNGNEWNAGTVAANDIIFNGDAQTLLAKLAAMEARIVELEAVTSGMPRNNE